MNVRKVSIAGEEFTTASLTQLPPPPGLWSGGGYELGGDLLETLGQVEAAADKHHLVVLWENGEVCYDPTGQYRSALRFAATSEGFISEAVWGKIE